MDVAYPLRHQRSNLDPLRWSLRSLSNLKGKIGRVILLGGLPEWVNPQTVTYIPVEQEARKFVHIGQNLQALCDIPDLTNPTLWLNDDQFILRHWEPHLSTRLRAMDDFVDSLRFVGATDHDAYVRGMRSQRDIMRAWGHDTKTTRCPDSHWPMPVDPDRLRAILKRVQDEFPAHELGHFKAIYAAGLDVPETRDCKIQLPNEGLLDLPVVSTSPMAWTGKAGREIRARFGEPSRFEL